MAMQEKFIKKIHDICEQYKEKVFITYMKEDDSEENWTYGEFWKRTNLVTKTIQSMGDKEGRAYSGFDSTDPICVYHDCSISHGRCGQRYSQSKSAIRRTGRVGGKIRYIRDCV